MPRSAIAGLGQGLHTTITVWFLAILAKFLGNPFHIVYITGASRGFLPPLGSAPAAGEAGFRRYVAGKIVMEESFHRIAVSGVKPAALSFRRGTPYQLRLRNTGAQDHTFVSAGFFQAIDLISREKYILIKG